MTTETETMSDHLVVDLGHYETVVAMLEDLGIGFTDSEHDDYLDLGLLMGLHSTVKDAGPVDVGELTGLLRQRAAADRDGWVPVIGRNRSVGAAIGEGAGPEVIAALGTKIMGASQPLRVTIDFVPEVPPVSEAGRHVRVGMVDTSISSSGDAGPLPYQTGHGVFVQSLIRKQAPAAEIVVPHGPEGRRIQLDSHAHADTWTVARAMMQLVREDRADILNLSLGMFTSSGGPPLVLMRAIERIGSDVLVVAAAGNHGQLTKLISGRTARSACWPAAISPVVAVGALDANGDRPGWSPNLPWVSCSALGDHVVGSYPTTPVTFDDGTEHTFETGFVTWSGTSFAAATVSGAVAARTVPGKITPRQALATLLKEDTLVKKFSVQP